MTKVIWAHTGKEMQIDIQFVDEILTTLGGKSRFVIGLK